jgi:HK97 family phage prohead protease
MIANSLKNNNLNLKNIDNVKYFAGYASIFNVVDYAGDMILPGAFIENQVEGIKLLWQHNHQNPIGIIDKAYEDERGLYVEGRIFLDISLGKEAYILIENKVTDHLSIGYEVLDCYYNGDICCITCVDLWEVSIVIFPANKYAEIIDICS